MPDVAEIHTFVKLLRERHGFLGAEAELASGFLLQAARDERGRRFARALLLLDGRDLPMARL